MKLLAKDLKQNKVKLLLETSEDVWFLSQLVDAGDTVSGKTVRKVKVSEEADPSKKQVFLALVVERADFTPEALRISGKIVDGPEDVPRGSYHTFSAEPGTSIELVKPKWFSYQIDRLEEACEVKQVKILVCVFDREEALFAVVKRSGYELLAHLHGDVARKRMQTDVKGNFFSEIVKQLEDYDVRFKLDFIVLASPAFWKDELFKVFKNDALRKKVVPASCSSVNERAISEVLGRDEVSSALRHERTSRELSIVEEILSEISRKGPVVYGLKNTKTAAEAGAVKELVVADSLIQRLRMSGDFPELDFILHTVDSQRGKIIIISTQHEGGKKLEGIGGIAALLRFKLSF